MKDQLTQGSYRVLCDITYLAVERNVERVQPMAFPAGYVNSLPSTSRICSFSDFLQVSDPLGAKVEKRRQASGRVKRAKLVFFQRVLRQKYVSPPWGVAAGGSGLHSPQETSILKMKL